MKHRERFLVLIEQIILQLSTFLEKKSVIILWTAIFTTLFAGIYFSVSRGELLNYNDEKQYYSIAENLTSHNKFSLNGENLTSYRPPGYPFILSLVMKVSTNVIVMRIFNYICLCLSIFLTYQILKKYSRIASSLGVIFIFCYPVLFYTASTLYPQTLATTLFLTTIFVYDHEKMCYQKKYLLMGVLMGLLILTVPTFIFIAVVFCIWILFAHRDIALYSLFTIILSLTLLIFPLTVRNYFVQGGWFFVSANGGLNLWLGNNSKTKPGIGADIEIVKLSPQYVSELEKGRAYEAIAMDYIYNNKAATLKMYLIKYLDYFSYWNDIKTSNIDTKWKKKIMMITYGFILISTIIRVILFKKYPLCYLDLLLLILYLSNGAFMSFFFNRIRFRLPFDLLLILINSKFYSQVINKYLK